MAKGFILVDMPEACLDCRFCREASEGIEACCELENNPEDNEEIREIDVSYTQEKPDWCPIQELPERKPERKIEEYTFGSLGKAFDSGWNAYADKILGKEVKEE